MADRRPSSAVASPSTPTFTDLGVPAILVDQMSAQGITTAFPIQSAIGVLRPSERASCPARVVPAALGN